MWKRGSRFTPGWALYLISHLNCCLSSLQSATDDNDNTAAGAKNTNKTEQGNSCMASEVMKSNKVSLNLEGLSSSMQQIASGYNNKYNNAKENIKVISLASLQFCPRCTLLSSQNSWDMLPPRLQVRKWMDGCALYRNLLQKLSRTQWKMSKDSVCELSRGWCLSMTIFFKSLPCKVGHGPPHQFWKGSLGG